MCECDGGFSALSTTAGGSVSSVTALMRKVAVLIVGGGLMRALIYGAETGVRGAEKLWPLGRTRQICGVWTLGLRWLEVLEFAWVLAMRASYASLRIWVRVRMGLWSIRLDTLY
jgi:hypothetical protein